MYTELTAGYHVDPERLINGAIFDVDYSEMVIVKDIPFYSLCEHHLLPFFGTAAVAYIPRGRVIGLSKIPRIVEMYARRLQVQERLTQQIADFLQDRLEPQGVGVVMEATHLCAVMRGVRKPGTIMTTSAVLGLFRTRDRTRAEFLAHLARSHARGLGSAQPSVDLGDRDPAGAAGDLDEVAVGDAPARPATRGPCRRSRRAAAGRSRCGRRHRGARSRTGTPVGRSTRTLFTPRVRRIGHVAGRSAEGQPQLVDAARELERAQVHVPRTCPAACRRRRRPRRPTGSSR